jgi:hypothetical protein
VRNKNNCGNKKKHIKMCREGKYIFIQQEETHLVAGIKIKNTKRGAKEHISI